ncbi:Gypsy retrotransposon integrase-like protein 1, partial [Mucuna pruriens]
MEEVHQGTFGTYTNGHALACKILRVSYYWTKMESDCCQHVRRCTKCQVYANNIHVAPSELHSLTFPWPFAMWGLDMIGPIESFILVAIDYFTKWVEAASYASVTKSIVVKFIKRDIIYRYGLPAHIITDNGTNLNNKIMPELCEQFKIKHHNSMPYRPKMNGAIEEANKNIKKIVQKMVLTYKDWHDMLPYALHGYRTSIQTSTGAIPYSLVFGTEAVLSVEVEIPPLKGLCRSRTKRLRMGPKSTGPAQLDRGKTLYQHRIKHVFDKKVGPRQFKEDLVLRKILPNARDPRGKWAPNYEGSYVVKHTFSRGALVLVNLEGQELQHPVNADTVKLFYP